MLFRSLFRKFPSKRLLPYSDKFRIKPLLTDQFFMRSPLYDMAAVQHKNLIRMADCLQSVSDHNKSLPFGQRLNSRLELGFVFRIDICRGLMFIYTNP